MSPSVWKSIEIEEKNYESKEMKYWKKMVVELDRPPYALVSSLAETKCANERKLIIVGATDLETPLLFRLAASVLSELKIELERQVMRNSFCEIIFCTPTISEILSLQSNPSFLRQMLYSASEEVGFACKKILESIK